MKFPSLIASAIALTLAANAHAGSATLTNDRTAFEAALVGPFTVETFGGVYSFPISTGVLNSATELAVSNGAPIHAGDIKPGVTYSTPVGESFFFNIDTGGGFTGGFLDGFYGGLPDRKLTVKFDQPVNAFGFDGNYLGGTQQVTIKFTDSSTQTFAAAPVGGMTFFGFTGSAIDSVTIGSANNGSSFAFAVDNVTFGKTSAVPEPESYAMVMGGLLVAGTLLRRRRSA